jgi:hypothetical protein
MTAPHAWTPAEGSLQEILKEYPKPLNALVSGEVPAIVLRQAFNPDHCVGLIERLYERGLVYDPRPIEDNEASNRPVYVGPAFVRYSPDPDKLFAYAADTHELFKTLFNGYANPVKTFYEMLSCLAPDKRVMTAREPDGRLYGPAVFRAYYADRGHGPHFDSVAKRQKLFHYQVSRFQYQFAGVMCFQNSENRGENGEPFLYNCPWTPAVQEYITAGTFSQYVAEQGIPRVQIQLEPGDLYFFFSENIHEVPPVVGEEPRIVLAAFFGMSPDDEEIFVWS